MKIAVTYEDGLIYQHFGHTAQFKLYDVRDGAVVSAEVVDTNGSGHGALAGFLANIGAKVLICGGIGGGAQMALAAAWPAVRMTLWRPISPARLTTIRMPAATIMTAIMARATPAATMAAGSIPATDKITPALRFGRAGAAYSSMGKTSREQ